jgi:diguanylate cyclase (GGDEF)-like protein/PAS domain S-box-containing protein
MAFGLPAARGGLAGETDLGDAGETDLGDAGETDLGDAGETDLGDAGETDLGDAGEADLGPERFRMAFEDSAIGMAIEDLDGRFLQVNAKLCKMVGYTPERLIGQPYTLVCHPDDVEDTSHLEGLRNGAIPTYTQEMRYVRSDGRTIRVRVHIGVIRAEDGRPRFYAAQIEDVSERHLAELRFRSAFEDAAVGMALGELRGHNPALIVEVNAATSRILGRSRAELVGSSLVALVHPDDADATLGAFGVLGDGTTRQSEVLARSVRPDGSIVWVHLSASVADTLDGTTGRGGPDGVGGADGPTLVVLHVQDVTARNVAEARLVHQADHDELTGLPNRHVLARHVAASMADRRGASAGDANSSALLFIDLDRFKLVNDSLGHAVGDELLVAVGARLESGVREDDVVARIGGDEFVVLLRSIRGTGDAELLAAHLHAVLSTPFDVGGRTLYVTASIGIAIISGGRTADDILRAADLAMYRSKLAGKARTTVYDASMQADAEMRLAVEQDIRRAVVTPGELVVWFQPVVSLVTGRAVSAEALVRWHHPERGLIGPDDFLPVCEETGLIIPVGWSVLDDTLRQVRGWRDAGVGLIASVNLSGRQLDEPRFVRRVTAALEHWDLRPADLCLEVKETVLVDAGSRAASSIQALRRLGISIAIDDFGRGYSSLAYLRLHPVDVVKVDRLFVAAVDTNPRDASIVDGIIQLTHALGMTCVAGGVEKPSQLARLTELGCDQVQGFLLGRPGPAELLSASPGYHEPEATPGRADWVDRSSA